MIILSIQIKSTYTNSSIDTKGIYGRHMRAMCREELKNSQQVLAAQQYSVITENSKCVYVFVLPITNVIDSSRMEIDQECTQPALLLPEGNYAVQEESLPGRLLAQRPFLTPKLQKPLICVIA